LPPQAPTVSNMTALEPLSAELAPAHTPPLLPIRLQISLAPVMINLYPEYAVMDRDKYVSHRCVCVRVCVCVWLRVQHASTILLGQ
jgi:hypothetical protein